MTIETDLFTRLTGFTGLIALVSTRIYPNQLPQGPSYPSLSYRRVSAVRESLMGVDAKNVRARFQFDVWAQTYASARAVTEQVRLALQRYSATNTVTIETIFFLNEVDLFEDDTLIHHTALDFEVIYRES